MCEERGEYAVPLVGTLSGETAPEDFGMARRSAAYWHLQEAIGLWPWYEDLAIFLEVAALGAGLVAEEDCRW